MPTRATPSYSTVIYSAIVKTWHEKPQLTGMLSYLLKPSWIWCSTTFLKNASSLVFLSTVWYSSTNFPPTFCPLLPSLQGHVTTLSTPPSRCYVTISSFSVRQDPTQAQHLPGFVPRGAHQRHRRHRQQHFTRQVSADVTSRLEKTREYYTRVFFKSKFIRTRLEFRLE